jgi:hypothetical protein
VTEPNLAREKALKLWDEYGYVTGRQAQAAREAHAAVPTPFTDEGAWKAYRAGRERFDREHP